MLLSRRSTLTGISAAALLAAGAPRMAFSAAPTDQRLVFIFLRGGVDGLSLVPAYGEPSFKAIRGPLADGDPGEGTIFDALKLDGMFALNPDLKAMHAMYQAGEMTVLHATCSGYRDRSHFDAQDTMDRGMVDKTLKTGWINRTLTTLPGQLKTGRDNYAMGLGPNLPLSLRGAEQVGSWSPPKQAQASPDTLERLAALYRRDTQLGPVLAKGLSTEQLGSSMSGMDMTGQGAGSAREFTEFAKAAATFLKAPDGPRLVTIDYGNWDSHADQNGRNNPNDPRVGNFAGRFPEFYLGLDRGINSLKTGLGPEVWAKTVVVLVTEFGRTVRINGTRGTDHGTGGAALLLGGAVKGGRVIADWPGLEDADLLDGRDLKPTTDVRALLKGVLREHMGVGDKALDETIFPDSRAIRPLEGLVRA